MSTSAFELVILSLTRHHFGGLPLHSHHINHLCSKGIVTYIAAILSRDQKNAAFTIHFIYLH